MVAISVETIASAEARAAATLASAVADANAYTDDAVAAVSAGSGTGEWNHQIIPWIDWKAASNTPTRTQSSSRLGGGYLSLANSSGNWIDFSVQLDAGTWDLTIIHDKGTPFGAFDVKLDGVTLGSVNFYNGTSLTNQAVSVSGFTVATTGDHTLRFLNTGTGGGSSYSAAINALGFQRTA